MHISGAYMSGLDGSEDMQGNSKTNKRPAAMSRLFPTRYKSHSWNLEKSTTELVRDRTNLSSALSSHQTRLSSNLRYRSPPIMAGMDLWRGNSTARTIVYLRPNTVETNNEVVLASANESFCFSLDYPITKQVEIFAPKDYQSPMHIYEDDLSDGDSMVTTVETQATYPNVIRLAFDSTTCLGRSGFLFGAGKIARSASTIEPDVYVPWDPKPITDHYFRIHYNFLSGVLMITSLCDIWIGESKLTKHQSLIIMPGQIIKTTGAKAYTFKVEFPDLQDCTDHHEFNYKKYAASLNILDAQYLVSPLERFEKFGPKHHLIARLGGGSYGNVFKVVHSGSGQLRAIKILKYSWDWEFKIFDKLAEHKNIPAYYGNFINEQGCRCIIMELAANDLGQHVISRPRGHISLETMRLVIKQSLQGLAHLHSNGIMHRDIKPSNILVTGWNKDTEYFDVKLTDFGLASEETEHHTYVGTEEWMAPEIAIASRRREAVQDRAERHASYGRELLDRKRDGKELYGSDTLLPYTNAVDIWSLGEVLKWLIKRHPLEKTFKGTTISLQLDPAREFASLMTRSDPSERPSVTECLASGWMMIPDRVAPQKRFASSSSAEAVPDQKRIAR